MEPGSIASIHNLQVMSPDDTMMVLPDGPAPVRPAPLLPSAVGNHSQDLQRAFPSAVGNHLQVSPELQLAVNTGVPRDGSITPRMQDDPIGVRTVTQQVVTQLYHTAGGNPEPSDTPQKQLLRQEVGSLSRSS